MRLYYDLHIHSCLSPCGSDDMTPSNLVRMAALCGVQVIALTDHNTCRNCRAAMRCGEENGLLVLPGMELTTREEIHVVCLFAELQNALAFDAYVFSKLQDIQNPAAIFGEQWLLDERDAPIGQIDRLLLQAADIPITQVSALAASYGGLCFPAHIDKDANSILAVLGDFPAEYGFPAAEVFRPSKCGQLIAAHPALRNTALLRNSDAHDLTQIADAAHWLEATNATCAGVLDALRGKAVSALHAASAL